MSQSLRVIVTGPVSRVCPCVVTVCAAEWSNWRRNAADGRRASVWKRVEFTVTRQQRPGHGSTDWLRRPEPQRHLVNALELLTALILKVQENKVKLGYIILRSEA